VIDLSNPAQPQLVGKCNKSYGATYDVTISGHYAYVGSAAGLQIIDISDPTNPRQVGATSELGTPRVLAVSGTKACLAGPNLSGLVVIDVSNPANPTKAGVFPGNIWSVAASGNYAYAADYEQGLQVIDISDPTNLRQVNGYQFTNCATKNIAFSGHYAYVSIVPRLLGEDSMHVFDITDLANPRWLGSNPWYFERAAAAFSGNFLYAPLYSPTPLIVMYDLSDPVHLQFVGAHSFPNPWDVAVFDSYVVAVGSPSGGGLQVFQPTLANPQRIARLDTSDRYRGGLILSGHYIYANSLDTGFSIIDISNPLQPTRVGSYTNSVGALKVSGSYVFASKGMAGFEVVDVSDPANPRCVGGFDTHGGPATDIAVFGSYAYLAVRYSGLLIFDVSNPAEPRQVGTVTPYLNDPSVRSMMISGGYAYLIARVRAHDFGLYIYDLANPANPRQVGVFSSPTNTILGVTLSGNYAYAYEATPNNIHYENYVIDISDPTQPRQVGGTYATLPFDFPSSGRYAYSPTEIGIDVWDISDPFLPKLVGGNYLFSCNSLLISGDKLYAAAYQGMYSRYSRYPDSGLVVLDLFKPLALTAAPRYAHQAMGLAVRGLAGLPVGIERSADLATWQSWTNLTLGSAPVELRDPAAPESPRQFYRAVAR
jgi:hypothetical protein